MKPAPVRPVLFSALGAGALFLASLLPAKAAEPVAGPTLTLEKLVVTTVPDYRMVEEGWQVGQVPGFLIFSHGNAAAARIADQLQLARAAFWLVWNDATLLQRPVTVVVTADEPEFLSWARLAPLAMDRTARIIDTSAGPVLLVNGALETSHRAAGRAYVIAQLQAGKLPRWFQEGIAQVVNSAEVEGDRIRIGRVPDNPLNAVSLVTLRDVEQSLRSSIEPGASRFENADKIVNTRGDRVDIRINGMVPTIQELERFLEGELKRREEQRYTYSPDTDFLTHLGDSTVMDLARVFDPAAPDTVAWRMNAWAFTHYSLFAGKQRHQAAFVKFVQQLGRESNRAPVDVLQETYGLTARKVELNLSLYTRGASYDIFDYKLAEPFRAATPAMATAPEANVLQLRARVLGATERGEEARQLLARGYANPENRTPSYVSQFIELERRHDPAHAADLLEDAARRERLDNSTRRMLAAARLERLQHAAGKLSPNDLSMVLGPLFAALEKGDQSEELFLLIGRAWAASAIPPKSEHLNALRLGLSYHPNSKPLAELLKQLEQPS